MRRVIVGFALVVAAGWYGCGQPQIPYSLSVPPSGTHVVTPTGSSGGVPDAGFYDGGYVDGGPFPTQACSPDADGTGTGTGLVISQISLLNPEFIELYNRGPNSADLGSYTFAGSLQGAVGNETLQADGRTVGPATLPTASGELGIYQQTSSGSTLIFYMCWGALGSTTLLQEASTAGVYDSNSCPPVPTGPNSLHLRGSGLNATDWQSASPTPDGCAPGV